MSIRDSFKKDYALVINQSLESISEDAEELSLEKSEVNQRIKPEINFQNPANFARFGSAKSYYEDSIKKIYTAYPYDGSKREKLGWRGSASFLDEWLIDTMYPSATGYVNLNADTNEGATDSNDLYSSLFLSVVGTGSVEGDKFADGKYINLYGGPRLGNIWDTGTNRRNNLHFNINKGFTVEFWYKNETQHTSSLRTEHLFHFINTSSSLNQKFELHAFHYVANADRLYFTTTVNTTTSSIELIMSDDFQNLDWNHFAFTTQYDPDLGFLYSKVFVNGNQTEVVSASLSSGTYSMAEWEVTGTLGAYCNLGQGGGYSQLVDGYFDEFRVWRKARTNLQIASNYHTNVHGGTNTDNYDSLLGLYYKFNEGITQTSSIDSVVLDYSGRVNNTSIENYDTTVRYTGSAINDFGYSEEADPIMYIQHPDVYNLNESLKATGTLWDYENNSSILKNIPAWIREEGDQELNKLTQIIASYFDKLFLQVSFMPEMKDTKYFISGSLTVPYMNRLLSSVGFPTDDLFIESDELEYLFNKSKDINFEQSLEETKSKILRRIYNNLVHIYKSKGTEKAFRNLFRCFGVDEEHVRLKSYADNEKFELDPNKRRKLTRRKNYLDLTGRQDQQSMLANVYQTWDGVNSSSYGYILGPTYMSGVSGSNLSAETTVVFPQQFDRFNDLYRFWPNSGLTGSIFGFYTPMQDYWSTDVVWDTDEIDIQLLFARKESYSKKGKFLLRVTGTILDQTSDYDLFEQSKWTFRLKTGTSSSFAGDRFSGSLNVPNVISVFGVREAYGEILDSFELKVENIPDSLDLYKAKQFYLGALRTNYTSSVIYPTECKYSYLRIYSCGLSYDDVINHSKDPFNYGVLRPSRNTHIYDTTSSLTYNPGEDCILMNWDFEDTGITASGGTVSVTDIVSGSGVGWIASASYLFDGSTTYGIADTTTIDYPNGFTLLSHANEGTAGSFFSAVRANNNSEWITLGRNISGEYSSYRNPSFNSAIVLTTGEVDKDTNGFSLHSTILETTTTDLTVRAVGINNTYQEGTDDIASSGVTGSLLRWVIAGAGTQAGGDKTDSKIAQLGVFTNELTMDHIKKLYVDGRAHDWRPIAEKEGLTLAHYYRLERMYESGGNFYVPDDGVVGGATMQIVNGDFSDLSYTDIPVGY